MRRAGVRSSICLLDIPWIAICPGGASANGRDDDQPIRADRHGTVARGFAARTRLALPLKSLKCFFPEFVKLTLDKAEWVRVGQTHDGSLIYRILERVLTRAPPGLPGCCRVWLSAGRPHPPPQQTGRLHHHRAVGSRPSGSSESSSSATSGAGTTRSIARSSCDAGIGNVEDLSAQVIPDGLGAAANPAVPACALRSWDRRPLATNQCSLGRGARLRWRSVARRCGSLVGRATPRRPDSSARPERRRPRRGREPAGSGLPASAASDRG